MSKLAAVAGAGGFIGGHLVKRLLSEGYSVRGVDVKPFDKWWQIPDDDPRVEIISSCDVGEEHYAYMTVDGADEVYNLAADMGGMGFITLNKLDCMLSVLPSTMMLKAAASCDVPRFFYSSSACAYPDYRQTDAVIVPLAEHEVYPAMPEDGYGWEKLFTERMCRHFEEDAGLVTRVGRYHNSYGPYGSWTGGREKAPAALCRKVATAVITGASSIEIWGDGNATRTFMYVDDCVEGTLRVMRGDFSDPVNIGSDEVFTVNQLAWLVQKVAGVELELLHIPGPEGVRGRSSDNTLIRKRYGWKPSTKLLDGLVPTYEWIYDQVKASLT